ncbi:lipopolysaccharide-induced tumor necrosis factor-alpha factor homolog [Danio aesculapii]|uniref:lipopolysaccharide-induced tumor necrosis factor-alpha factor homolog n=1 Tax=Danio aesculapii TaxID=1142201 RepID=UPI0024C02F59|nr:lipopolysaccharide-induced tumor necrosis factor-alpha factor homolog [Danio aesculapii]
MDKSEELEDLEKDYLEEMEAIEALEAIGTLESAPPYPGHPGDYGGLNLGHNLAYISSPYPNVNMGYTSFPEPGVNTHYQGGPNPYPQATTVTTTVRMPNLSDLPAQTMCPHCKLQVITITEHYSGLSAWVACGCLALIGCWPCCLMPFWMDSCKDVEHRCPNCNNILCYYKRL